VYDDGYDKGALFFIGDRKQAPPDHLDDGKSLPRRMDEGKKSGGQGQGRDEPPGPEEPEKDPPKEDFFRHGTQEGPHKQENEEKRKLRGEPDGHEIRWIPPEEIDEEEYRQDQETESSGPQKPPPDIPENVPSADAQRGKQTALGAENEQKENRFKDPDASDGGKGRELQDAEKIETGRFNGENGSQGKEESFSAYPA